MCWEIILSNSSFCYMAVLSDMEVKIWTNLTKREVGEWFFVYCIANFEFHSPKYYFLQKHGSQGPLRVPQSNA